LLKRLKKKDLKHRSKISEQQARFIAFVIVIPVFVILLVNFVFTADDTVDAEAFVDLQEGAQAFSGFRRAHAKGMCVNGYFRSNAQLQGYSRADVFKQGEYPIIGRFSIAGNNPYANDLNAPVRSLAFVINPESNSQWRVAMNTPPVMAVKTPQAFFQQLQALQALPDTGKPDPEKIKAFFEAHPESASFLEWKSNYSPTASFALEKYHSINAFYLVNDSKQKQAARFHAQPRLSQPLVAPIESDGPDALQQQLLAQLNQGDLNFDLVFTLANEQDDETDPTVLWPEERRQIVAGEIIIKQAVPQQDGACFDINFNPLILPDGIQATEDPILKARSASYAESYKRRSQEMLLQAISGGD